MTTDTETFETSWQGIPVTVSFSPEPFSSYRDVYGAALSHIAVTSDGGRPLSITDTGFWSMWVRADILAEWGGPVAYVLGMLDLAADDPAWIAHREQPEQLTLF